MVRLFALLTRSDRRRRLRLTSLGAVIAGGALCVGVFSVDTRQTLAFQVASLLVSLLAVSALFAARFRPPLRVQRDLPDYATVGMSTTYTLRIDNLSLKQAQSSIGVVDQLSTVLPSPSEYRGYHEAAELDNWFDRLLGFRRWLRLVTLRRGAGIEPVTIPRLPPAAGLEVPISLVPLRRGYLHFESTVLQRPDPLGLINALKIVSNPGALLVLPRRYRVPNIALGSHRRYQPGGMHMAGSVGDSREFLSLRDYSAGDPLRHIHWRSWARTGRPIVKQFQDEFFNRQALILDTFAEGGACFEEAVSLAASFVLNQHETDALTDLLFVGARSVQAQAGRGLGSATRLLELLACAQPAARENFDVLHRLVVQSAARLSGAIVVLLGWDDARRALIGHLRALRVALVVLIVGDIKVDRLVPGPMRDQPGQFAIVRPGHIEEDLVSLSSAMAGNSARVGA
ncbi:MAG: DUF58 domain-containing protein [Chromatiales bacterium]